MAISDELRKLVDPNNECCCEHCLSNKCKEWAYNQGYVLDCFSKCIEIRKKNEEDILYIERGELFDDSSYDISLVFKACQWILDNKKEGN